MEYKITGDNLQFVNIELSSGDKVYAEAGTMAYMTGNVAITAKARGGVWKGIKRKFTGETFFLTEFVAQGGDGVVGFGGNVPGKIILQSMTLPQLANALVPFLPRQSSGSQGFGIRVGGR